MSTAAMSPAVRATTWGLVAGVVALAVYMRAHGPTQVGRDSFDARPFREFNSWVNSFMYPRQLVQLASAAFGPYAALYVLTYMRNVAGGSLLYYATSSCWHWYIYVFRGETYFPKEEGKPSRETIVDQIKLAQASMFLYAGLPVLAEWFIEEGYTVCYYRIAEVGGWPQYAAYMLLYLGLVEIMIYWMHRTLHTNKFLYKYVHALHHKYNKPSTLSPWASVAFNPLDGIMQACPYVICLFIVPCHYLTHVIMLFYTAVWATNIHDAMPGDSEPIMGSKYHTVHHTHYHVNFGQFFIFCDWFWGTLKVPKSRPAPTVTALPTKEQKSL